MYNDGDEFISAGLNKTFNEVAGKGYYETFETKQQLNLLDSHSSDASSTTVPTALYSFHKLVKLINKQGTISPNGPIVDTPTKIKLPLKIHQKRTLAEMKSRESSMYRHSSGHNVNLLCDDVGSGKSLCVLSLIADSPMAKFKTDLYYSSEPTFVRGWKAQPPHNSRIRSLYGSKYALASSLDVNEDSIELKTNLIIIPHNVFNQWKKYIQEYTTLSAIFIGGKKDYTPLCSSKENIIKKCDENDIILVKSTMYKKLIENLDIKLGWTELNYKFNEGNNSNGVNLRQELMKLTGLTKKNFNAFLGLTDTCNNTTDNISEVREEFKSMAEQLNKFITSENWDDIEANRCQRVTKNKAFIEGYYFQRVIVDEVDSIKVSAFPYSYAKQTWFVSSSINNLLYPTNFNPWNDKARKYELISSGIKGTGFLRELLFGMFNTSCSYRTKIENMRGLYSVVRNNIDFIQYSINIPPTNVHYLECYTPPHLSAIKNAISKEALKAFNAGDVTKAIEILGCIGSTEENIVANLTKKFHNIIADLREKLLIKEDSIKTLQIEYDSVTAEVLSLIGHDYQALHLLEIRKDDIKRQIINLRSAMSLIKSKILDSETKIEGISSRIKDTNSKQCPICYSEFSNPSITPCCNNVFCIECITMALDSSSKKECPLCRKSINIKDVNLIINSESVKEPEGRLKTKLEALLDIIKSKPDKRLMVFSEYNSTLNTLTEEFLSNKIDYSSIKGHSSTIERTLNNFKEKKFNVLLLNATHFGAGLNLQFTDEIIIWHRMSGDLERQVIGRAQRLGRKTPLEITYLCYDNEYQTISK